MATLLPRIGDERFDVKVLCVHPHGPWLPALRNLVVEPTGPGRILARILAPVFHRPALYRLRLVASLPLILFNIRAVVRRERPDVVMTCSAVWSGVFFLSGLAMGRRSFEWVIREGSNIASGLKAMRFYLRWPLYISSAVPMRHADRVIIPSKGCRVAFMEYFGLKKRNIRVIHNPIDLEEVSRALADRPTVRKEIAFVGRLEKVKNVDVLIQAFHLSGLAAEGFRLIVYGVGSQHADLRRLVEALALQESVAFEGFVRDRYERIARASLMVLPSKREGFGNVVLEAMAVGTPVIVSDCDFGPKELVLRGRCGVVVKKDCAASLAEGLVRVLRNGDLSRRNVSAARERAREYDVVHIAGQYKAAFAGR